MQTSANNLESGVLKVMKVLAYQRQSLKRTSQFQFSICSNRHLLCVNVDLHVFNLVNIHVVAIVTVICLMIYRVIKCLSV